MIKVFFTLIVTISAFAIVTIKPVEVDSKKDIKFEIGGSYKNISGNTQKSEYLIETKIEKYFKKDVLFFIGKYKYATVNEIENTNDTYYHLREIHNLTKFNALEIYSQLQSNPFKSIDSRLLLGIGDRLRFDINSSKLFIGIGLYSYWLKEDGTDEIQGYRENSYISYTGDFNKIKYTYIGYYQPLLKDINDYHIINNMQLKYTLTTNIKLSINIAYQYDSKPAINRKNQDLTQIVGFIYTY